MFIMDLLDDLIFGPLNLINRTEGWLKLLSYHDSGYRFAIPRQDKGGRHSLSHVREILKRYGISTFGCTHDSKSIYFLVKRRQAVWTEYLLLQAGIELNNPPVDPHNAGYKEKHPPGWMPKPWSEQNPENDDAARPSWWQKLNRSIDDLLE